MLKTFVVPLMLSANQRQHQNTMLTAHVSMNSGYLCERKTSLNRAEDVMRSCVEEVEARNAVKIKLAKQKERANQDKPEHKVNINDVRNWTKIQIGSPG